ncbi:type IV pilus biogenesis protein PilP [Pectobacterium carotovorum]|uniref:type IV pilus biogenesis protein PilP n=1 Tax=Pectobacterium carotovorum TaxID=554 RepID=UPI0032ED31E1
MLQLNNCRPTTTCLLLLILFYAVQTQASESTSPVSPPSLTQGELEQLHTRNILLQAQVQGAQLQRQLEENRAGTGPSVVPPPPNAVGYTSLPGSVTRSITSSSRPVVIEISGRDKNLHATLQLASGQTLVVSPGSQLPGIEQTVKSITLAGVTLSDGTLLVFGG